MQRFMQRVSRIAGERFDDVRQKNLPKEKSTPRFQAFLP
jgi:hypothetical protein